MSEAQLDIELVKRVQKGDKAAFDLLVLKYQQKVAYIVARYIKDASEVQDVCQEAFIKAYRGLARFRNESTFYTWLYRIATNAAKNHLLSQSRKANHGAANIDEISPYGGVVALQEQASPERELLTYELQTEVQSAIEALPEDLRLAITLREFCLLSYEEIAEVMECPIGTVRSRIFRAREAINARIEPFLGEKRGAVEDVKV